MGRFERMYEDAKKQYEFWGERAKHMAQDSIEQKNYEQAKHNYHLCGRWLKEKKERDEARGKK